MRNFFYFLTKHSTFILFLILEGICAILVVNYNDYQRASFFSSSNVVCGKIYSTQNSIARYFSLTDENNQLIEENIQLRNRVDILEKSIDLQIDTTSVKTDISEKRKYVYRSARAINSTINRARNFITADAGSKKGIKQDMVVINNNGVVGLVTAVSENYSSIMPIINTSFRLSVKLANSHFKGQLTWNGFSARYAQMIDVPEHATVAVGDIIVTSGSSSYFPEGLPVGIVEEVDMDKNGGFYRINVKLAADYSAIYNIEILENLELKEQLELEKEYEND